MKQISEGKLDWILILTLLIQILVGSAFIYSVSGGVDEYIKENHRGGLVYFHLYLLALVFSLVTIGVAYKYYSSQFIEKYAYWLVDLAIILIIATLIPSVGWKHNGSSRAINFGFTTLYIVPMATIFLIVGASRYFAESFNAPQTISLSALKVIGIFLFFQFCFIISQTIS